MAKNDRRHFPESNPHVDGENEGPISDPLGGPEMGIKTDHHPLHLYEEKNPYGNVTLQPSKEMKKFQSFFQKEE